MKKIKLKSTLHIAGLGTCEVGSTVICSDEQAAHIVEKMEQASYIDSADNQAKSAKGKNTNTKK